MAADGDQPGDGGRGHPRQVHQVHHGRVGRLVPSSAASPARSDAPIPSAQSGASTAPHARREHRTDLVRAGAEHDDDGRGAALGERAQRAHHQRLAVQLDERLRPAHPASRAGGQQQPRRSYRFTSVCGWV